MYNEIYNSFYDYLIKNIVNFRLFVLNQFSEIY